MSNDLGADMTLLMMEEQEAFFDQPYTAVAPGSTLLDGLWPEPQGQPVEAVGLPAAVPAGWPTQGQQLKAGVVSWE